MGIWRFANVQDLRVKEEALMALLKGFPKEFLSEEDWRWFNGDLALSSF